MKKIRVGLIGCGTIGRELARFIDKQLSSQASLVCLCDHHKERALGLQKILSGNIPIVSFSELARRADFIIEAASGDAAFETARLILKNPAKEALILSVGGLLRRESLIRKAASGGRIWIPSGAIAGVDGLLAAMEGKVKRVKIITRKPPAGLRQAPYFQMHPFPKLKIGESRRVFKGSAVKAVENFPQNVNVSAVLSLAGIGARKTEVEVWTSETYKVNRHEILIEAESGRMHIDLENQPSKTNPKTSALAANSAMALLRKIFSRVRIGT